MTIMKIDKRTIKAVLSTLAIILALWLGLTGRAWVRQTNANARLLVDYIVGCQQVGALPTGQQIQGALAQAAARQPQRQAVPILPAPSAPSKSREPKK